MFVFNWPSSLFWGFRQRTKYAINAADLTDREGTQMLSNVKCGEWVYDPDPGFVSIDEDVAVKVVLGTFEINCPGTPRGTTISLNGERLKNVRAIDVSIRLGQPVTVKVEFIDKPSGKTLGPSQA